jgi:hypothetical protein
MEKAIIMTRDGTEPSTTSRRCVPLLFMQHFRGGLDHWDPAVTDRLGKDRPVILFNNAGVARLKWRDPRTLSMRWHSTRATLSPRWASRGSTFLASRSAAMWPNHSRCSMRSLSAVSCSWVRGREPANGREPARSIPVFVFLTFRAQPVRGQSVLGTSPSA